MRATLLSKYSGETKIVTFDFLSQLATAETISTAVTTATVFSGTDASPSAIVSGSTTISGTTVTQKITAGVTGVIYDVLCTVTTSLGQTLQQDGLLAVIPTSI